MNNVLQIAHFVLPVGPHSIACGKALALSGGPSVKQSA